MTRYPKARLFVVSSLALAMAGIGASLRANTAADLQRVFFDPIDKALLHALQNPRVNIAGVRRADLHPLLDGLSPNRLSRQLHRLRNIGLIKRVAGTYRYYLTRIGRAATAALCRVTQSVIIPALA